MTSRYQPAAIATFYDTCLPDASRRERIRLSLELWRRLDAAIERGAPADTMTGAAALLAISACGWLSLEPGEIEWPIVDSLDRSGDVDAMLAMIGGRCWSALIRELSIAAGGSRELGLAIDVVMDAYCQDPRRLTTHRDAAQISDGPWTSAWREVWSQGRDAALSDLERISEALRQLVNEGREPQKCQDHIELLEISRRSLANLTPEEDAQHKQEAAQTLAARRIEVASWADRDDSGRTQIIIQRPAEKAR